MTSLLKHKNLTPSIGSLKKNLRPPKPETSKPSTLYLKNLSEKINEIFNSEYEDTFSSILILKQNEFLSQISTNSLQFLKEIYKNNELYSTYAKDSIKKAESAIKTKYLLNYKLLSLSWNNYENKNSNFQVLKHFRKHCSFTDPIAYHPCHNNKSKLIEIKDNNNSVIYLICIACKKCFPASSVLLYCNNCKCDYFSSVLSPKDNIDILPATWSKYHCGSLVNETMKCVKCKGVLYLNLITGMLICMNKKCNFTSKPQSIIWNCSVCKKDFSSEAKIFNPMELQVIKKAIKQALLLKHKVYPKIVPCCKVKPETVSFYHKNECRGLLYKGMYNKQTIIVCSKCYAMNFYDKFIWTCPLCRNRFKNLANIDYSHIEWSSFFNKKQNSDVANPEKVKRNSVSACCQKYSSNSNNSGINYLDSSLGNNNNNQSTSADINDQGTSDSNNGSRIIEPYQVSKSLRKRGRYNTLIEILEERNPGLRLALTNRKAQSKTEGELINCLSRQSKNCEEEKNSPGKSYQKRISSFINMVSKSEYSRGRKIELPSPSLKKDKLPKKIAINLFEAFNSDEFEKDSEKSTLNAQNSKAPIRKSISHCENREKKNFLNSDEEDDDDDDDLEYSCEKVYIQTIPSMVANSNHYLEEIINSSKIPSFSMDNYKILKPIGEGAFGKIYSIQNAKSKTKFALKKIIAHDSKEVKKIQKEFELVYLHPNNNIMKIYNIQYKCLDFSTYSVYVLMELAVSDWNMEIKKRIDKKNYYKEQELIHIVKQLVSALAYLQVQKVAHRDIKPQNVLLYPNSVYKVADFGEAKEIKISKQQNTLRGTELYMSPVLYNGLKWNKKDVLHNVYKSDVFSLGYCLLYAASLNFKIISEIRELKDMKELNKIMVKYFGFRYSKKFWFLLMKMVEYEEKKRLDFLELEKYLKDNF